MKATIIGLGLIGGSISIELNREGSAFEVSGVDASGVDVSGGSPRTTGEKPVA